MSWKSRAKSWLHEPLLQMLVAGLVVALVASATAPDYDAEDGEIVVSEPVVRSIIEQYSRTWQRLPSDSELDGLIADYVREEALVREARRLGLDADDEIVRKRLAAKMKTILRSEVEADTPDEDAIKAYYDENWRKYAPPQSVSFDQIYLGEVSGAAAANAAREIKAQLAGGADWRALGSPLLVDQSFDNVELDRVEREIGGEFAKTLPGAPQGQWSGPVSSAYGAHLVRLRAVDDSQRLPLAEVREQVLADWREAVATQGVDEASAALVERYTVRIERP